MVGGCKVSVVGQAGSQRLMDAATQHTLAALRREVVAIRGRLLGLRRLSVEAGNSTAAAQAGAAIAARADLLQRQCRVRIGEAEAESRRLRRVIEQLRGCVRVVARVRPSKRGKRSAGNGSGHRAVEFPSESSLAVRVHGRAGLAGLGSPVGSTKGDGSSVQVFDFDRVLRPSHG